MSGANIELHNVAEVTEKLEGLQLNRLPSTLCDQLNDNARQRTNWNAGCELRFNLESPVARLTLQKAEFPGIVEIYHGGFLHDWQMIGTESTTITVQQPDPNHNTSVYHRQHPQPFDPNLVRVLLPWRGPTYIIKLDGDFSLPHPDQTPELTYLAYGSSITQGNGAIRPSGTYPARIGQILGVDVINMGFGGGAHCEAEMAAFIANRQDWDFASLEMGINMLGNFTVEEFSSRVNTFVETITNAHPDKWVFCLDLFPFGGDLLGNEEKAPAFRQVVRDAVDRINHPHCVHIEAFSLMPQASDLTTDLVHPAPAGLETIGHNLAEVIGSYLE